MPEKVEIIKPGLGLGGATFDVAATGEALHDEGYDVHLTSGTIDEGSRRFLASLGLPDVAIAPALDRFHPDHSIEKVDPIVRAHDGEIVIFNQAFQTGPF